jgi:mRNA-degrading endonuclease RelE of RelBE toxin-antitoxin system
MSHILMAVVEVPQFVRQAADVWTEDERADFIDYIALHPDAGEIIPQTGGVRKVRWGRRGSGKRGGVRVIYYYHDMNHPLYLLMIYAKAARADVSREARDALAEFSARLKRSLRH